MIFEDNKNVPISELISYVYGNTNIKVHFSGGNRNLKAKLAEVYNEEDRYTIFFDLVPDNQTAINEYRKLSDYIGEKEYGNVTIIPIPCIEYYVLKVIGNREVREIEEVLNFGQYKSTDLCVNLLRGNCKNFEGFCKKVLAHKTAICYRNELGERYGAWYKEDCICGEPKPECVPKTRMWKGCSLVVQLPVCYLNDDLDECCKQKGINEKNVRDECVKKYKEVEAAFKEYGYIG